MLQFFLKSATTAIESVGAANGDSTASAVSRTLIESIGTANGDSIATAVGRAIKIAMSNYLENALINHIFRAIAYAGPATTYVALLTTNAVPSDTGTTISSGGGTGVEVSGGNYSRQTVLSDTTNWAAPSLGLTSNTNAIIWTSVTWTGVVVGLALVDDLTDGNILFFGPLVDPMLISPGDTVTLASGQLIVTIS